MHTDKYKTVSPVLYCYLILLAFTKEHSRTCNTGFLKIIHLLTQMPNLYFRNRGILHSFSGTETNKIWPYVYTLVSNKIPPIQAEEAN